MTQFNDFALRESTQKLIELEGFQEPTAIQAAVIPVALKGRDLIGISETGTGKTHAFLIPLMEKIKPELPQVQAVITAPTRELAMQIYNRAKTMMKADLRLRVRLITGGWTGKNGGSRENPAAFSHRHAGPDQGFILGSGSAAG